MKLIEKTLNEKTIYEGSFLKLIKQEVLLPDGNIAKRDILRHPGAVAIIAFKDENTVVMVEQYRKAIDRVLLEIPAGKLEKDEDILECARRELEEEIGYTSNDIEYLGNFITAPGFCDEVIHLFKAKNLKEKFAKGDDDEFINIKEFSLEEIKRLIKNGIIVDCKTIAALQYI
ncbi:NUDIX hydrolase [Clostridium fallax]|uniref:ADP-ribose pyrophosphatase n=1 Tax=Clostridium fallax TaxID=1533 RepID=A0A1M4XL22_9CLOT|nr:NUDIX hydrolase [Clostridium fallax]SHE94307.1 ADP-ribose pyrophosphatase [Clostridium fallax]SQB06361.1 NUDIX hydrolase [Clostridium fallax]